MALLKEHEKYKTMTPAQVFTKGDEEAVTTFDVSRTTNATGEQFHFQCPVYKTDTREELKDRMHMLMDVVQQRMEDENEAHSRNEKIQQKIRLQAEIIGFRKKELEAAHNKLELVGKREKWTEKTKTEKKKILVSKFEAAMTEISGTEEPLEIVKLKSKKLDEYTVIQ